MATRSQGDARAAYLDAVIANADATGLSSIVETWGVAVFGFGMPADWTAANLTFQVDPGDGTYRNLYDNLGNEVTVIAADDRYIPVDNPNLFAGVHGVKVRSGTSAAPVAQLAERTLRVVTGSVLS